MSAAKFIFFLSVKNCSFLYSAAAAPRNLGFIGLGNMGIHMAVNLINNGHQVIVYDIVQKHMEEAASKGKCFCRNCYIAWSNILPVDYRSQLAILVECRLVSFCSKLK